MIITITNNKGGVGKTAIACNLGAALARQKKSVLAIDYDPQSNLTKNLLNGLERPFGIFQLLDPEYDKPISVKDCVYTSPQQDGLLVLANSIDSSGLDLEFSNRFPESIDYLKTKIFEYAKTFDFCLIDTPPSIGNFTAQALNISDMALIPVDSSSADSLEGLKWAIKLIKSISGQNKRIKDTKFIINKVHGKKTICKAVIMELRKYFKDDMILKTQISETTAMAQACFSKQTIYTYDNTRPVAREFTALAREIIGLYSNG